VLLVGSTAFYGFADTFTDELQWLAMLTACIGQYNMAQTGDYSVQDPHDYYQPRDIREWLARQSGDRTVTQTFYGICFDYAQWAYDHIKQNAGQYEALGMKKGGWYIVGALNNPRQLTLYDPVSRDRATAILNGVPLKEFSRQNVRAHGDAVMHAWLWVYGNDGTIYWIDPTWTDNAGYVWWGVVRNGEETQTRPAAEYCMVPLPNAAAFDDFNRGNANKNMGEWDEAIAQYTETLRKDPNNAMAYNNRGAAYHDKGMNDQAIADCNQAIRLDPNFATAYLNRGNAYRAKGMYDQAIADYTQAIRLDPNDAGAYLNRGNVYDDKGMYDQAIADYNQAIRLDPNFAMAYYNRGNAYRAKGMYDQAIADYTQAIRLNSNYASAYHNRGAAYHDKRMYDQAIADYSQAIRLDPNDASAYHNRGIVYDGKKDYDRAIADYTQAIRLNPNYTNAYYNRGCVYYDKGDYARARVDWNRVLQLNPNHADARNNLNVLGNRGR
jgi:tetratricopeptide (TPR) repeat protein